MKEQEILDNARKKLMPRCNVCPVCNGAVCHSRLPGPGGKGEGRTYLRNYQYLANHVKLQMEVLAEGTAEQDTKVELFGKTISTPIFPAPIGMVAFTYSDALDEDTYAEAVVVGAKQAGTIAFTGGGLQEKCFTAPLEVIQKQGGWGIPTLKPWVMEAVEQRIPQAIVSGAIAIAMDIDGAALVQANSVDCDMCFKTEADLQRIVSLSSVPFIAKGIMKADDAIKAARAGVYGIVVSNHGGRAIEDGLATAEVLPNIKEALGDSIKIFVDGGVRSGSDVFKMLALGADGVLIGRPYAIAAYGGGAEGVAFYTEKWTRELKSVMQITGCHTIADITRDKIAIVP